MVKPALIALTMMGCDCDAKLCVPVDAPPRHFVSLEDCEAAIGAAVEAEAGRLYPLLKAECRQEPGVADLLVADASGRIPAPPPAAADDGEGVLGRGFDYAGRAGEYLLFRTADGVVAVRDGLGWAVDRLTGGASWALALLAR